MVITADLHRRTDGVAHSMLLQINSKLPLVIVSRVEDYVFNTELLNLDKYILVDFTEYCWDWDRNYTHIWGVNTNGFNDRLTAGEWDKFDEFVKNNPPVLTFKRELLKKDLSDNLLPIEYPCIVNVTEKQSWGEYHSRPLTSFFYWGRSHEARVKLHAKIWLHSSEKGYSVCDNLYYFQNFLKEENNPNKWATMYIPHYGRTDISNILQINSQSKTSISLAGSGLKCFRHSESSVNSLMSMEKNDFAWTFEWDETNTIQFEVGKEIETIEHAIEHENIYVKYVKCVENCRNYYLPNYIAHLEKIISERV